MNIATLSTLGEREDITEQHRETIFPFSNPSTCSYQRRRSLQPLQLVPIHGCLAIQDTQNFSLQLCFLLSLRTGETLHYTNVVQASGISAK